MDPILIGFSLEDEQISYECVWVKGMNKWMYVSAVYGCEEITIYTFKQRIVIDNCQKYTIK